MRSKVTCECGVNVLEHNLAKHERSIQHKKWSGEISVLAKRVACECGETVLERNLAKHKRSIRH